LINQRSRFPFLIIAWVIGLGLFFVLNGRVSAQEKTPQPSDDDVNAVAKQLFCPVCENVSLDVCPTQACAQWRALVREKLAAGWSEQQIKEYFVIQYGDRVLAEPPRRGLNWLIYILPPLFLLAGAIILFRVLRGMRQAPAVEVKQFGQPKKDDPYLVRMEEELRKKEH
jgi:cytochrome c-type biogenesis protein CcmH